jgi:hypothetical protein
MDSLWDRYCYAGCNCVARFEVDATVQDQHKRSFGNPIVSWTLQKAFPIGGSIKCHGLLRV